MRKLLAVLLILWIYDAAITLFAMQVGYVVELNPLYAVNDDVFWFAKGLGISALVVISQSLQNRSPELAKQAILASGTILAVVGVWNTVVVLRGVLP